MKEVCLSVRSVEYHYYSFEVADDFDPSDKVSVENLLLFSSQMPDEREVADEEIERVEVRAGENWEIVWSSYN